MPTIQSSLIALADLFAPISMDVKIPIIIALTISKSITSANVLSKLSIVLTEKEHKLFSAYLWEPKSDATKTYTMDT